MSGQRVHVYELGAELPARGPGVRHRAKCVEPGGALEVGEDATVRLIDESDLPDDGPTLEELVQQHAAVREVGSESVLTPVEFGIVATEGGRRFWAVTSWTDASPLADVLRRVGAFPDPLTESIGKQVAETIRDLHAAGVAGLCLGPSRFLLRGDSSVLAAEPALAALLEALQPEEGDAHEGQHAASPQRLRGESTDAEADDLFSVGALLYRLIVGEWPRAGTTVEELREDPIDGPRPNDRRPHSSIFLSEVVRKLLRADPADRFDSAATLCRILDERRKSEWWDGLGIGQNTTLHPARGEPAARTEPAPLPIPAPAIPPDEEWLAAHTRPPEPFLRHPAACIGRDAELSGLLGTVRELESEGGEVVLIEAPAGVGKTRFVDAVVQRLGELPAERRPLVLTGTFRNLGIGRPLQAFSQLVTGMFGSGREISPEQIQPLLGDATGIAESFAALVSGRARPDGAPSLSRHSVATAFAHVFRTLAERRPVVVVLENLQFADPESLELFGFLARLAGSLPLLVVATYRPPPEGSALRATLSALEPVEHLSRARLEPLTDEETTELVHVLVAPDPRREALAQRLVASARGRAGLVVQTLLLLRDRGVLGGGPFERLSFVDAAPLGAIEADGDDVYAARIAALSQPARELAQVAAIQGLYFDSDVARIALDWAHGRVEEVLAELADRFLVTGRGGVWRFTDHSLFLHATAELDDETLARLHESVADAFLGSRNPDARPPGSTHGVLSYRVAWHYLLAERPLRGLLYVPKALVHLRETWRLGVAERLAAQACRALAELPDRAGELTDMRLERAQLLGQLGRRAEQRELLQQALLWARERDDAQRQARAHLAQATLYEDVHRLRDAREEARLALQCAQRAGDKRVISRSHVLLGRVAFGEARYQQARTQLKRALEMARELLDDIAAAEALQALGHISQGVGSFEHAEELQREAMRIYRRSGDLAHEADSLQSLGQISAALGDRVKAEGYLRRSLAIHRALGDGYAEARVLGALGVVVQDSGRPIEALELHRQCLAVTRDMGARDLEIVALLNLAASSYLVGRLDEARAEYGDALRAARETRDRRLQGYALSGLGDVARQKGETEIAEGLARRALRQLRKVEDQAGLSAALLGLGRTLLQWGKDGGAKTALEDAVSVSASVSARGVTALAQAYLALLQARDGEEEDAQARIAQAGALVQSLKGSESTRIELLFVHSLVLRVLGRPVEADRKMLRAEAVLTTFAESLPEPERAALLTGLSPHREILAGAAAAREGLRALGRGLEDTAPVE